MFLIANLTFLNEGRVSHLTQFLNTLLVLLLLSPF